jgi:cell division protein FtsB
VSDQAYPSRSGSGIWHSLNRFILTLIVLAGAVPIGYSFLPEVHKREEQETRIEQLKLEIEKQRMSLVRHQREETLLKHDPEYVGLIARDRLDLMKEGETIFRMTPTSPAPAQMRSTR